LFLEEEMSKSAQTDPTPVTPATVAAVVRKKGSAIGRSRLEQIGDHEVKILNPAFGIGATCLCRIRGMTYCVCTDPDKPSLSTFEPSTFASKTGCRHSHRGGIKPDHC
jgi:hypothetical protein